MNLVWFRNDLRTDDNPALHYACIDDSADVVAVYTLCEKQWDIHGVGNRHRALILSALENLKKSLFELNIPFIVLSSENYESAVTDIQIFCANNNINKIFFNIEHGFNERARDQKLFEVTKDTIKAHRFHGQYLLPPFDVRNNANKPYKVFTPFARLVKHRLENELNVYQAPKPRRKISKFTVSERLRLIYELNNYSNNAGIHGALPDIREKRIQNLLMSFVKSKLKNYSQNRDYPSVEVTSRLSSALSVGALSVSRAYTTADHFGGELSQTWCRQLIWRDFYRYIMWHFPRVSRAQAFLKVDRGINWNTENADFEKWKTGNTGVPIVDAAMRQLNETGWMHNRLRMIVASFLSKNLWLNWRLGERYFASQLWDYDFANNNGGWQWCASVGTDAAPYFRVLNPATQGKKYDPQAKFIRNWVSELSNKTEKQIHAFESKPIAGYSPSIVDLKVTRRYAIDSFKKTLEINKVLEHE